MRNIILYSVVIFVSALLLTPSNSEAMGKLGAVPLEVLGSYGVGAASLIVTVPIGNLFNTDSWGAGGFLASMLIGYPVGTALGTYAVGELAEGDSENDALSAGVTIGVSLATMNIARLVGGFKGIMYGLIALPLVDTLTYNLVKTLNDDENASSSNQAQYRPLISFSIQL